MTPSMSDIKFLLVLLRYKTFNIKFLLKVISFRNIHFVFFYNLFENRSVLQSELLFFICYMFIYSLVKTFFQPHKHQELQSSHVSMSIDSNLFRARVGVYNLNMRSCKKEPNIHIKRLTIMPLKKSFKIPFFMLIILFLLFFSTLYSFLFLKVHLGVF